MHGHDENRSRKAEEAQASHAADRLRRGGTIRFVQNRIVRFLLDQYKPGLNDLAVRFGSPDDLADYEQLMMLIGYSVSGFGDLDLDRRTVSVADRQAKALIAARRGRSPAAEGDDT
jgi:hypothetical protein